MQPAGDRQRKHVMTIIDRLTSIFDRRVASEAEWVQINKIAATGGTEFEYQRLIARVIGFGGPKARTEIGAQAPNFKYRDHEWYADQLP
jgi:hypothetical protein